MGYGSGLSERSEEDDDERCCGRAASALTAKRLDRLACEPRRSETRREKPEPCRSAVYSVWCACGLGLSVRAVQKRTPSLKFLPSRLLFLASFPCALRLWDDKKTQSMPPPQLEEDKSSLVVNSIALSHEHGLIPPLSHDTLWQNTGSDSLQRQLPTDKALQTQPQTTQAHSTQQWPTWSSAETWAGPTAAWPSTPSRLPSLPSSKAARKLEGRKEGARGEGGWRGGAVFLSVQASLWVGPCYQCIVRLMRASEGVMQDASLCFPLVVCVCMHPLQHPTHPSMLLLLPPPHPTHHTLPPSLPPSASTQPPRDDRVQQVVPELGAYHFHRCL